MEDGAINTQDNHYWSNTDSYFVREIHHQRKFSASVWCGILNEKLIGPIFYDGTLTCFKCVQLIYYCKVTDLMETMPLSFLKNIYYQHNGHKCHYRIFLHIICGSVLSAGSIFSPFKKISSDNPNQCIIRR